MEHTPAALARKITVRPLPGADFPSSFAFFRTKTDKNLLVLLDSDPAVGDFRYLASLDLASYERKPLLRPEEGDTDENLTLEEKLRRERQRDLSTGVTSFSILGGRALMVPLQGNIYLLDPVEDRPSLREILSSAGGAPLLDVRATSSGKKLAFVRNNDLYMVQSDDGKAFGSPILLSIPESKDTPGLSNGLASFIAQEELDRQHGYWWSRDGSRIAYERVDERQIPQYTIVHQCDNVTEEKHHYPFAGASNPPAELWVCNVDARANGDTSPSIKLDLTMSNGDTDIYLARVDWLPDDDLLVQLLNRDQTRLEMYRFSFKQSSPTKQLVLTETSDYWVNVHDNLDPLDEAGYFVWSSERSGFSQLYLYKLSGNDQLATLVRTITNSNLLVENIVSIDERHGLIYFLGNTQDAPLERHLFVANLRSDEAGSTALCLTPKGTNYVVLDGLSGRMILHNSSLESPPHISLEQLPSPEAISKELLRIHLAAKGSDGEAVGKDKKLKVKAEPEIVHYGPLQRNFERPTNPSLTLQTTLLHVIHAARPDIAIPSFVTRPPSVLSFQVNSCDPPETLYAQVYIPPESFKGPHKTIVQIYGGPHVQRVKDEWFSTMDLRAHALSSLGYLVVRCDNRGTSRRGLRFESHIFKRMGSIELDDQIECLEVLQKMGLCDLDAGVGITGWSYGGYMTAMALAKHPKIFRVGISGAPVTSWDGYDTAYTERYMRTPEVNPDGYNDGSVMTHAHNIIGKLLLVHGLIDENVHFRHTARLIDKMIQLGKPYDLLVFPDERHGPRKLASRVYLEERLLSYFIDNL